MSGLKKVTAEQVKEIIALYQSGQSMGQIASLFPISEHSVWSLLNTRGIERRPKRGTRPPPVRTTGAASGAVKEALRKGKLVRPNECEQCRRSSSPRADGKHGLDAHHDDYNFPLQVRWLCPDCHIKWHLTNQPIAKIPNGREGMRGKWFKLSEVIVQQAVTEYLAGMNSVELAEKYRCTAPTIRWHLVRRGVKIRPTSESRRPKGYKRAEPG